MKKTIAGMLIGIAVLGTSCKKYLDINTNPNQATSATPELILPQALTYTASVTNSYNSYGSQTGMYAANAGGYGGFGESITYNYTTSNTGLWGITYDNLEDYQAILNKTAGQDIYDYYNAAARVMKAYEFQLLVDAFNDVPYESALQGSNNLTPAYSSGKDIYKDLANQLDTAIALFNAGANVPGVTPLGSADVLFGGSATKWKKFANTLKLRLIIRGGDKVDFANKTFSSDGFLTTDALVNPGYNRDNGKQNPAWNTWAYGYTGSAANKAWMPSKFIFGFYDGNTIIDTARGTAIYFKFPNTGINQLGVESNNLVSSPTGSFWFSGTDRDGTANGNQVGILKGPDAGQPLMLASESYFLQAEAALKGIITDGDPAVLFDKGITAAFNYTFQLPDGSVSEDIPALVTKYKADNSSKYLVNFALANTTDKKEEAIITQKFIALNFVNGQEAWNEYRRTHYPTIVPGGTGYQTFASTVSESTRPDKLPTRIMYPVSESTYNGANVPTGIAPFTSLIFWAQ
ncbi:SusD/RagB family nutrient-binding outer membrane lipoprotein [Ferruginibacter paludis]|uniref:SusD/RagB family nutrient-binding outer membrane lipoprotein n=1 Tax=Ferruginibacter paludis TaxID=1310417 RepID=UPI0025B2DB68|nr:SusD/RagB family nutrient-binding outer membrane lipoprotein [Ferruginibacter paludis]MDN3658463.1 SusD/RagB family nutrient-binding outer membrane lipoprotein [Ferruginibacter paludis]